MRTYCAIILLTLVFIPVGLSAGSGDTTVSPHWHQNMEEALTEAGALGRPVLVSFTGSDWCIPCMRLERDLFSTDDFIEFADENLILARFDFPMKRKNQPDAMQRMHNDSLAAIYNMRGTFPAVILTDSIGNVIGRMQHPLPAASSYIKSIEAILATRESRKP